jgi:3-oxoacyl-[acyl-carrier-protein] synthase II
MVQRCDVVITGIGLVTPIGTGREAYWSSLLEGRSGIAPLAKALGTELPVQFGGELKDFDAKQYVKPRKSLKVMCHEIQVGYSATMLAMEDAGLNQGAVAPDRMGVVFGSEMFSCDVSELADAYRKCVVDGQIRPELWGEGAMKDLYPLWMLKYLPNMIGCHAAIALGCSRPQQHDHLGRGLQSAGVDRSGVRHPAWGGRRHVGRWGRDAGQSDSHVVPGRQRLVASQR